ncbi:HAMP domain-containing histidine kinase, partial [Bacteroides salyersiae]
RKIILMLILGMSLIPSVATMATVTVASADSLQRLLKTVPNAEKRAIINVHLADIYTDSIDISNMYWNNALNEARSAKDEYVIKLALDILVKRYAESDLQKVDKYISIARQSLPGKNNELFLAYLYCYKVWYEMRKLNNLKGIENELVEMRNDSSKKISLEAEIQQEYLTGISQDFSSTATGSYRKIPEAIPYIEHALKKLSAFPLQDRVHFEMLCRFELSDLYMIVRDKRALEESEKIIQLYEQLKSLNSTFVRSFQDDSCFYMKMYSHILFQTDLLSKEKCTEYYHKYMKLAQKKKQMHDFYENSARYYETMEDYSKAISYIDSAIVYGSYRRSELLPIYVLRANLCYKIGDYKNAFLTIKRKDSLHVIDNSDRILEQMSEMRTRFNVYKLELEKDKLTDKNRLLALIGVVIIITILIGWGFYQSHMVKKLRRIYGELYIANEEVKRQSFKATESEKMKTAFLHSICHEVRTPMNSINGFSQLLLEESLDSDTKKECQNAIQKNIDALSSIINDMLELSELISSEANLPVQKVNVHGLCVEELEILRKKIPNHNVECFIRGNNDNLEITTNGFYLSRVIGNLINNAAKFTEKGTIVLEYQVETEKDKLIITVSDTGIGVPLDKQEWVFERFTKVDDFKPGTGLGLYVCRNIIQRLGGSIFIDSEYVEGCRVVISLPL